MATLPGLQKGVTKDPTPPATDTVVSPITIPNGTILVTTKTTNETIDNVDQLIDYVSGDNSPNFIPQSAISSLVSDLAGKEILSNKVTVIGTPGNDTNYPTEKAVRDGLDLKENSLGFTPEDSANKGAVNGYAGLDSSQLLLLANFPTGTALQVLRRNAANTALEFVDPTSGSEVFTWTNNHDADGNNFLLSGGLIQFADANTTISQSGTNLRFDIATSGTFIHIINSITEFSVSATKVNIHGNILDLNGGNIQFESAATIITQIGDDLRLDVALSGKIDLRVGNTSIFSLSSTGANGGGFKIVNVADPTSPQHVVTKAFAEANFLGLTTVLNDLSDVTITTPADNDLLEFDTTGSQWKNRQGVFTGITGLGVQTQDLVIGTANEIIMSDSTEIRWVNGNRRLFNDASGFIWEVEVGDTFALRINITNEYLFDATQADFLGNALVNAPHNHEAAAGGGQLNALNALDATGTKDSTTFLRGDNTWAVPLASAEFLGPWTATHDAGNQTLSNVGQINMNDTTKLEWGTGRIIYDSTVGFTVEVDDGNDNILFKINGLNQFNIGINEIDIFGNNLANINTINLSGNIGLADTQELNWAGANPNRAIQNTTAGFFFKVETGDFIKYQINAIDEYIFDATQADFLGNALVNAPHNHQSAAGGGQLDSTLALSDSANIARNSNNLSFFSATTSAQLAGIISDETGTGLLVFSISPTITTPTITNPILVTPTIASFVNAQHNHEAAAGGGQLNALNALDATGTKDSTTFLRGDNTWAVPAGGGGGSDTPWTEAHDFAGFLLTWDVSATNDITTQQVGDILTTIVVDNVLGNGVQIAGNSFGNLSVVTTNAGNVWRSDLRNDMQVTADASGFFQITSAILPTSDSGSNPVMVFDSRQNDNTTIVFRDLFSFRNNGASMLDVSRSAVWKFLATTELTGLNRIVMNNYTGGENVNDFIRMESSHRIVWDETSGIQVSFIAGLNGQLQFGVDDILSLQITPAAVVFSGGQAISNIGSLAFVESGTSTITGIPTDQGILVNLASGDVFRIDLSSIVQYTFSSSTLDMHNNSMIGLANAIFNDGGDINTGTVGGSMIAASSTQKIAFWGSTPIVQPAHIANPTGGVNEDVEARAAINSILAQLALTGLQASS